MIIRKAELNDYFAINSLNSEELGYKFSIEDTKKQMEKIINNPSAIILVAIIDNKVVGYVHGNDYDCTYAPHTIDVIALAVFNEYKNKGVGRKLMLAIEEWALEGNSEIVRVVSGSQREGAHLFYNKCGYECSKQQINFKKSIKK